MSSATSKATYFTLDICCGLGGFHQSFEGKIDTLDIDPDLHPTFLADVKTFSTREIYDVILAAPPCEEYSRWHVRGMNPRLRARLERGDLKPPTDDIALAVKRIIEEVQPKVWIVECVVGSIHNLDDIFGKEHRFRCCSRILWTNLPLDKERLKAIKLPLKRRFFGSIAYNQGKSKMAYLNKSKIEKELSDYLWEETKKYLA